MFDIKKFKTNNTKIIKSFSWFLLIISILLVSPYIIGYITKNQFYNIINNLNKSSKLSHNNKIHYYIEDYKSGWLESKARFKIKINENKGDKQSYSQTLLIKNGPFIFSLPKGSHFLDHFKFAIFYGSFEFKSNEINNLFFNLDVKPFKLKYLGKMNYILNTNLKVDLNNLKAHLNYQFDNINFDSKFNIVNGARFNFFINNNFSNFKLNASLNKISSKYRLSIGYLDKLFSNISSTSEIKNIIIKVNSTKSSKNIWNNENQININKININLKNNLENEPLNNKASPKTMLNGIKSISSYLDKFTINIGNKISIPNNSYNFSINSNITELIKQKTLSDNSKTKSSYGPIVFNLGLNNLYLPSILNLLKLEELSTTPNNNIDSKNKNKNAYINSTNDLNKLITPNTNFNIYFGFNKSNGTLNKDDFFIDSKMTWDLKNNLKIKSPFELFLLNKTNTDIYASKQEVYNIIDIIFNNFVDFSPTKAKNFVNFLAAEGFIETDNNLDHYKTNIRTYGPIIKLNDQLFNIDSQMAEFNKITQKTV